MQANSKHFRASFGLLGCVIAVAFAACATPGAPLSADVRDPGRRAYYTGMRLLADGSYLKAARAFEAVAGSRQHAKYAHLAQLRLGDALFLQARYAEAAEIYRAFSHRYETDPNLPYARFRVAVCYYERIPSAWFLTPPAHEFDQVLTRQAEVELKAFVALFPTSAYAVEARDMLARTRRMLFAHERYAMKFYAAREKWRAVGARWDEAAVRFPELAGTEGYAWERASAWKKAKDLERERAALEAYVAAHPKGTHQAAAVQELARVVSALAALPPEKPAEQVPVPGDAGEEPPEGGEGAEDGEDGDAGEGDDDGPHDFKLKMPDLAPLPE